VLELREELTRAGATPDEALQLALLLERAAEPARFEISRAELESALERARPRRRPFRVPRVVLAAAAVAAAAVAVILFLPSQQQSVQARALEALGGDDNVLYLRMQIFSRVPGASGTSFREVWFDAERNRVRWTQRGEDGFPIAETLVERGLFERVFPNSGTRLVGSSCRAFAAGCAEVVDPVTRYREALERTDARPVRMTFEGRSAYRFILPLQGRIDQVVFVDAETYLPRAINWREHTGADRVFVAATIELTDVEILDRDDAKNAFALPSSRRTVRIVPAGPKLGERRLTLGQARAAHPFWLGRDDLTDIRELRYARGRAFVARYGTVEIWTFGNALPPEVLAPRLSEIKTLPVDGRPATLFSNGIRLTVVVEGAPSFAVIAPSATKADVIELAGSARRLR
jgi:hypothetical protein